MIKQSYSHSSFNYFYHATKPHRCIVAAQRPALQQLYSLAPYELSLKHHEAPYSWNWFPWLRRRLLPFWPLFSCGPHVQIRTAGRTKPVVLKDGVLSESMWVYLALPCLPSSFMYRICPLCLGFAQVGHVGPKLDLPWLQELSPTKQSWSMLLISLVRPETETELRNTKIQELELSGRAI